MFAAVLHWPCAAALAALSSNDRSDLPTPALSMAPLVIALVTSALALVCVTTISGSNAIPLPEKPVARGALVRVTGHVIHRDEAVVEVSERVPRADIDERRVRCLVRGRPELNDAVAVAEIGQKRRVPGRLVDRHVIDRGTFGDTVEVAPVHCHLPHRPVEHQAGCDGAALVIDREELRRDCLDRAAALLG